MKVGGNVVNCSRRETWARRMIMSFHSMDILRVAATLCEFVFPEFIRRSGVNPRFGVTLL